MLDSRPVRITLAAVILTAIAIGAVFVAMTSANSGSGTVSAADIARGATVQATADQDQQGEPWLGVMLARTPDGVTIAQVIADSPADKAGLKRGDVIKAIDGSDVGQVKDVRDALDGKSVGDAVTLTIVRDGSQQDVTVTLEARPEPLPKAIPFFPELEGIAPGDMFSHMLGGEFSFTDKDGNTVKATVEAGTVASVDASGGKLTVNLNAGGSKTYDVQDEDVFPGKKLSDLAEGDKVVVLTVNGDVRAVFRGGLFPFMPGLGPGHGFGHGHGHGFGHGGFDGGFGPGAGWFSAPETAPKVAPSGSGM